jgi:Cu(I)/Ag(I) efflux system periplasmic protein CusF
MKTKFLGALVCLVLGNGSTVFAMGDEHRDHQQHSMVSEKTIHATGTVKSLAQNHETLRIFHDPIPELKWPSMNMAFEVSDHELTHLLSIGDRVDFEFIQKEGKNIIVRMKKQ